MSERIQSRIDNFDANKAAAEQTQFEDSLYGEAGSTDFSDAARTRLNEANTYENDLQAMSKREGQTDDEYYDAQFRNGIIDASHDEALVINAQYDAEQAEAEQNSAAFEERIQSDPRVRRMQMLAADIARLADTRVSSEDEARLSAAYEDKQNKLEELLVKFDETFAFSPEERAIIIDRIIDMTEKPAYSSEEQHKRMEERLGGGDTTATESESEPQEPESEPDEEGDSNEEAKERELAESDEQPEGAEEADKSGTEPADEPEAAKDSPKSTSGISEDGLELTDDKPHSSGISEDGLELTDDKQPRDGESLEEFEARSGIDDEESATSDDEVEKTDDETPARPSFRQRMNNRYDHTGQVASVKLNSMTNRLRSSERSDSDDSNERSRKARKVLLLGVIAVAAVVGAKYGFEMATSGADDAVRDLTPKGRNGGNGGGGVNWNDFDPSARNVTNGEGWNQTFKEMGIPKSEWSDVLKSAGPKLGKLGEAYYDTGSAEWRISRPGALSQDALRVIARSSRKNGVDLS